MFQEFQVIFPIPTINLTTQRIRILSKLFIQNGGQISEFYSNSTYIIVGNDCTKEKAFQHYIDFEKYQQMFIQADWISQSLLHKKLQSITNYLQFPKLETLQQQCAEIEIENENENENFIEEQLSQQTQKIKDDKKRTLFLAEMMNLFPYLLNYDYTQDNEQEKQDEFTFLEEEIIQKKEEAQEQKIEDIPNFKGDEECHITEVKSPFEKLFEGIEVKESFKPEQPITCVAIKQQEVVQTEERAPQFWEPKGAKFVCEQGDSHQSFNNQIIQELEKLLRIYTNDKDKGRCIAYRKAIGYIKSLTFPIKSENDILGLPTIGQKIKNKIIEIIQTGKLKKVESLYNTEENKAITELCRVWHIGAERAWEFYKKGIKSIQDLKQHSYLLDRMQLIGLKYFEELEQRIPRDEATDIYLKVKQAIDELSDIPDIYEAIPCGSYRRGNQSCGDIDILITRKDGREPKDLLLKLVKKLDKILLTDHLTMPKQNKQSNCESYMGICQVYPQGLHRRIDIKYYPREQYGCAVLYFTGSGHFNQSMRLYAQKKNYMLSDHGVHPTMRNQRNKIIWKGELIPCTTEMDVFQLLGMKYIKPEDRGV